MASEKWSNPTVCLVPMSWPSEYARHLDVRTTSIYPVPKMSPDRALVHIQNRCRVRRYSESHETSDLRPFTFGHRKRAVANRATLLRGLRHAPSPDHPRQPQRRTCLPDSPLAGLRLPDGARCYPRLQSTGLGCLGGRILTSEANPSRL